jgi:hypothetical protein
LTSATLPESFKALSLSPLILFCIETVALVDFCKAESEVPYELDKELTLLSGKKRSNWSLSEEVISEISSRNYIKDTRFRAVSLLLILDEKMLMIPSE